MKSSSALCKTFCLHFLHSGDAVHSCSIKQRLAVSDSQVYVFYISTLYNVFSSEISISTCKSNTQLKLSIKSMYISLFCMCVHTTHVHTPGLLVVLLFSLIATPFRSYIKVAMSVYHSAKHSLLWSTTRKFPCQ